MSTRKEHIVIIGGGFAGLNLVRELDKDKYRITLVDRNNFHSFPPLFYQVAAGCLDPAGICFPLRGEIKHFISKDCRYHIGNVHEINVVQKTVRTQFETIDYDKLIIAAGTTNNFFGIDGIDKMVYSLKSTSEALKLRNALLEQYELASLEKDITKQRDMLQFVVVGGGPTGVEIAGALAEIKNYIVPREYPSINPDNIKITIVEGSDKLLGTMSQKSSVDALEALSSMKVDFMFKSVVTGYDGKILKCKNGSEIPASMVIWTAGVTTVGINFTGANISYGRGHRIIVDTLNRVKDVDDIFAVGDICIIENDTEYPNGHPQLAQPAIQQAINLARNLNNPSRKNAFRYHDKGSMATIGRNKAVVDLPHAHYKGFTAWFTWMFIHLISIFGVRNKLSVFINWIWAYFTYGSSLRLLFKDEQN